MRRWVHPTRRVHSVPLKRPESDLKQVIDMTGTVCDACNACKDNRGICTWLPGKKVCQGCSKAHKTCKVNGRPMSGYKTKNNDGRESPRKRRKIVSKVIIDASEDEVAEEMAQAADDTEEITSHGEDEAETSDVETEVSGVSHATHTQWLNATLAERIAWRQGDSMSLLIDLMQWQVEASERQEEVLRDQARSLARMADAMEKAAGGATKFADTMKLFACGDRYLRTWEMGWSGNEQEEAPLKSAWKDRLKRAESGDGSGSGAGSGAGVMDAEATLQ